MNEWTTMYDPSGREFKVIPSINSFIIMLLNLSFDNPVKAPVVETPVVTPTVEEPIVETPVVTPTVEEPVVETVATTTTTRTRKGTA